jgi:hypothetical protein
MGFGTGMRIAPRINMMICPLWRMIRKLSFDGQQRVLDNGRL